MKKISFKKASAVTGLMLLLVLSLSACGEDKAKPQEQFGFKSVEDCLKNPKFTKQDCQGAYEKALKDFNISAPKFNSLDDCEQQYGKGKCGTNAPQG